jgi:hypothetical protein
MVLSYGHVTGLGSRMLATQKPIFSRKESVGRNHFYSRANIQEDEEAIVLKASSWGNQKHKGVL